MSTLKYIVWTISSRYGKYISDILNTESGRRRHIVIDVRVDELLEEHGRSFYWLSKKTGISHSTIWRLKKGKALGINFVTLEKLCRGLDCQPGEVLRLATEKKMVKRRGARKE
jgi:putative transcriptional regulator